MPIKIPKKIKTPEEKFEATYQKYFAEAIGDIYKNICAEGLIPKTTEIEKAAIIKKAINYPCAFRLIDDVQNDRIIPLIKKDAFFPFKSEITNKDFFRLVHPNYLIPYLVYARIAFEISVSNEVSYEGVMASCLQIVVPLKLEPDGDYIWYIQRGIPLVLNQQNKILAHYNTYTFFRNYNPHETMYIEPQVLINEQPNFAYHQLVKQKWSEHIKKLVFNNTIHTAIISKINLNLKNKNMGVGFSLNLIKICEEIKIGNRTLTYPNFNLNVKAIKHIMQEQTDQNFKGIVDIVIFLRNEKIFV